jgi:hypothetical protein
MILGVNLRIVKACGAIERVVAVWAEIVVVDARCATGCAQ